jgi:cobaltochelatase CobT
MDLESIPEKDRPLIIELGKVFEEIDLPPGDRSSPRVSSATIELQARKGQFLAAYRKLRQDHEEVVTVPEMLPDKEALQEAWQKLQKEYSQQARTSRRLGRKLENWLKSQTGTQPTPECEEGQIDLGRLAGIVSNPNNPNIYTGEAPAPRLSTAVSLLFDYSASMGGEQIITANLLSHQVVTALERCRIASEVLGFTTNDDKSLHIVVKDYRQRLQSAENNFGIAGVQEKMGGTNDTDAILWATDRLLKRSEDRKILVVVSDIQPNVSFIRSEFPDLHYDALLKSVIMHIERMKGVEIIGIGIDTHTSASHYYANGINLKGPKELGPVLIAKLQQVLGPKEVHASLRALNKPAVSKSRTAVPA